MLSCYKYRSEYRYLLCGWSQAERMGVDSVNLSIYTVRKADFSVASAAHTDLWHAVMVLSRPRAVHLSLGAFFLFSTIIVMSRHCFSGSKYCPMLVRERGVEMLKDLLAAHQSDVYSSEIRQLTQSIIERCERFDVDNDYLTDDDQESTDMNEWMVSNFVASFRWSPQTIKHRITGVFNSVLSTPCLGIFYPNISHCAARNCTKWYNQALADRLTGFSVASI